MLRALAALLLIAFFWHVAPSPERHIYKQVDRAASVTMTTDAAKPASPLEGGQPQPEKKAVDAKQPAADWSTNPVSQMRWRDVYAKSRYGSWQAAYEHWTVNHRW